MHIVDFESYENIQFENIDLEDHTLQEVTFYRCTFEASSFQYTELIDCEFQECQFIGCNMAVAVFSNSKVIDTKFHDSKLLGINWGNLGPVIVASYSNCLMDRCAFSSQNLLKVKFNSCSLRKQLFQIVSCRVLNLMIVISLAVSSIRRTCPPLILHRPVIIS